MIDQFRKGDALRAKDLNGMLSEIRSLSDEMQKLRTAGKTSVTAGPGIYVNGNSVSAAKKAMLPRNRGIIGEPTLPFEAAFSVKDDKLNIFVNSGVWFGRGSYLCNGIPDFDAYPVAESSWEGTPGGKFALVLYAPARCGEISEAPAVYLIEIASQKELYDKLRDYNYTSAAVIGIWEFKDGSVEPAPGQILKDNFRYISHTGAGTLFGWSRCDGAKASFRVEKGIVLLRPHTASAGQNLGDVLYFVGKNDSETVEIKIPQTTHTLKTVYPESEIAFLRRVTLVSDNSSTVSANVEMPTYKITAQKETASITYATASGAKTVKHLTGVELDKSTTSFAYIAPGPDGTAENSEIASVSGLLTVQTSLSETSETVSVPVLGTATKSITYVAGATVTPDAATTVAINIPTAQSLDSEVVSFKPIESVELQTTESEIVQELTYATGGLGIEEPDENRLAEIKSEIFTASTLLEPLTPAFHEVTGGEFSVPDSMLEAGAIFWLYCKVENDKFSAEWYISDAGAEKIPPEIGDIPQKISLSVATKKIQATTVGGVDTVALVVVPTADAEKAKTYATAFPMAFVKKSAGSQAVLQPLRSGILEFSPRIEIELNKEESSEITTVTAENKLTATSNANASELLTGVKITKSNAEAALEAMLEGAPAAYNLEDADFAQAMIGV